jgi:hypothetical protein
MSSSVCTSMRVAAHKELGRCIDSIPRVESVDYLDPATSPSGRPETEIVVRKTATGTVPNSLLCKISFSTLGIAEIVPANNADYKRVVVR